MERPDNRQPIVTDNRQPTTDNRRPASRPAVLFLSVNDGSDTRINKEISTLARHAEVHFVGVQQEAEERAFVRDAAASVHLVRGRRKSPGTVWRLIRTARRLLRDLRPHSIHVVNEDLAMAMAPVLRGHPRVVIDVFDSFFLRNQFPGSVGGVLERWAYGLAKHVLVTDETRAGLLPPAAAEKLVLLENFPYAARTGTLARRKADGKLRIYAGGTLHRARGLEFLRGLLETSEDVEAVMAGWLYDKKARAMSRHPKVRFLGAVTQRRSMELAAEADYILCLYEPNCRNNIYASPNKIYDALQAETPVIINREAKVSKFVEENGLGVVLDSYGESDYPRVTTALRDLLPNFHVPESLKQQCTWEAIEHRLLEAHELLVVSRCGYPVNANGVPGGAESE